MAMCSGALQIKQNCFDELEDLRKAILFNNSIPFQRVQRLVVPKFCSRCVGLLSVNNKAICFNRHILLVDKLRFWFQTMFVNLLGMRSMGFICCWVAMIGPGYDRDGYENDAGEGEARFFQCELAHMRI